MSSISDYEELTQNLFSGNLKLLEVMGSPNLIIETDRERGERRIYSSDGSKVEKIGRVIIGKSSIKLAESPSTSHLNKQSQVKTVSEDKMPSYEVEYYRRKGGKRVLATLELQEKVNIFFYTDEGYLKENLNTDGFSEINEIYDSLYKKFYYDYQRLWAALERGDFTGFWYINPSRNECISLIEYDRGKKLLKEYIKKIERKAKTCKAENAIFKGICSDFGNFFRSKINSDKNLKCIGFNVEAERILVEAEDGYFCVGHDTTLVVDYRQKACIYNSKGSEEMPKILNTFFIFQDKIVF